MSKKNISKALLMILLMTMLSGCGDKKSEDVATSTDAVATETEATVEEKTEENVTEKKNEEKRKKRIKITNSPIQSIVKKAAKKK